MRGGCQIMLKREHALHGFVYETVAREYGRLVDVEGRAIVI